MAAGEFPEGSRTLRAKIDMAHPNLVMRDPVLYRIKKVAHHRTGDKWCIYPMYDFTHCISDSIERVTHSICTLEFEDNRALYDWVLDRLGLYHPQQIEFARLNLEFTVMSKRILSTLVREGVVEGWDDPRMPTIVGLRRRGFTPGALRSFCEMIGVAKRDSTVDMGKLEWAIRNDLNPSSPRVMAVTDPVRLVIDNYPAGQEEELSAPYFPDDPPKMGHRQVPFGGELWVEREDFMAEPHKKFWRLAPGREVRLRWAYLVTCTGYETDADGRVTVIHCDYDPATKGGDAPDGRKVKGTIHWVSARHALEAEVRLYDRLFVVPNPSASKGGGDFRDHLNPESLVRVQGKVEPSLAQARPEERYQFERKGYFCVDRQDSAPGRPVFNRTVTLRDSWAKLMQKEQGGKGGKGGGGGGQGKKG
jgi:glutaminyl-tRNA synthetase